MSTSNPSLQLPTIEKSSIIFEESLMRIRRDTLKVDHHPPYSYYTLETYPFAVVVLAILKNGAYLLIEEYRHPTGKIILGCPAGYLDKGESPIEAAQRELLEETGYEAESFTLIGSAYPYAGFSGQKNYFVRAFNASCKSSPKLEQSEIIRPRILTPREFEQAVAQNSEIDANLGTALYFNSLRDDRA